MKKFLALALFAIASLSAAAEGWYAGGALGYNHKSYEVDDDLEIKADMFTIAPEVGYSLNDKWTVGASLNYTWMKDAYNRFAINPYARYTFFRTSNNLVNLFVDGGVGLGFLKPEDGDTSSTWEIGFKPGIAINLTEKFSLVSHIGFLGYQDLKEAGKTYGISFDATQISFGFYYNF